MGTTHRLTRLAGVLFACIYLTFCSKDKGLQPCQRVTEKTGNGHLVDIRALENTTELMDTLSKYSQLRVFEVIDDQYTLGMHCHVFYKDLIVFTDHYRLFKSKRDGAMHGDSTFVQHINLSLAPALKYSEAVKIAMGTLDFKGRCVTYRLGIYDKNSGDGSMIKDYRLVWKVDTEKEYPIVIVDAQSGQVYYKDDGIRI